MDKLQLHKKKFRNRKIRARLIRIIVILLIGYVSIFCGLGLLNSINKGKVITSNWITEQTIRLDCYDMIQYQKAYPNAKLTEQAEMLCKQWKE